MQVVDEKVAEMDSLDNYDMARFRVRVVSEVHTVVPKTRTIRRQLVLRQLDGKRTPPHWIAGQQRLLKSKWDVSEAEVIGWLRKRLASSVERERKRIASYK